MKSMKGMKGLKVDLHCLGHGDRALHFFYELAHSIARAFMSFMVNLLVQLFTMKSTKSLKETHPVSGLKHQCLSLLHVLHGQFACIAVAVPPWLGDLKYQQHSETGHSSHSNAGRCRIHS